MPANLYIAFCEDNQSVANEISKKLSPSGFKFELLSSKTVGDNLEGLTYLIARTKGPGMLLLSDNFLKDERCMINMLSFLQNSAVAEKMQIVVIDGQYQNETVETAFDRVSNVIQYMNYWQEKYLEMRKQKRSLDSASETSLNDRLQRVKDISSEIGDFLRLVRNKDFWTQDQFVYNNYEVFFKKFGNKSLHDNFTKSAKTVAPTETKASSAPPAMPTPEAPTVSGKETTPEVLSINDRFAKKPSVAKEVPPPTPSKVVPPPEPKPEPVMEKTKMTEESQKVITVNEMFEKTESDSSSEKNKSLSLVEQAIQAANRIKKIHDEQAPKEEEEIEEVLAEVENFDVSDTLAIKPELENPDLEKDNLESQKALESVFKNDAVEEISEDEVIEELDIPMEDEALSPEMDTEEAFSNTMGEMENFYEEEDDDDIDVMEGLEIEDDDEEEIEEEFEEIYSDEEIEDIEEEIEIEDVVFPEDVPGVDLTEHINAAQSLLKKGAVTEGVQMFEGLLQQHPEDAALRFAYAIALWQEVHKPKLAIQQLERTIKIDSDFVPAYRALGELAEQNNDFLLAKGYFEKVIYLNPDESGIYYKLGLITAGFYAEKPKLAAKYFKKAIQQEPNKEDAYYRLGLLQSEFLEKDKKALDNFHKTLEINPVHPFANYDIALLYHKMGDQKNAAVYYKKAWTINPEIKTSENDKAFFYEEPVADLSSETATVQMHKPLYDNDKIILITGATSGIGRATAEIFASHGFRIIITGRRVERLKILKTFFEGKYNTSVKTLQFDVRNIDAVKSIINNLEEEWQNIDVLINNAGLAKGFAPVHEGDIDHWETMIDTNIKGLLYLTRAVSPSMVKRRSGQIINVCSTAGKEVYPNGNVYCATKYAVDALTKGMRLDLYKHNIRVGQVSPAHVEETEFARVRFEDEEKAKIYEDFQPLKSSDVADAIFYMVNTPAHVNVQDIVLMGRQQANSTNIDRSGRD